MKQLIKLLLTLFCFFNSLNAGKKAYPVSAKATDFIHVEENRPVLDLSDKQLP